MIGIEDTITAIATPIGNGGVSIIRISGNKAFDIIAKIFSVKNISAGRIYHGNILDNGEKIDDVIVLPFRSPNSYTGEDVVEIQCHGGIYITKKILDLTVKMGARLAQRGEYTKRAFLNKKIDLSQAEAVLDLIQAKSEKFALKSSKNLFGKLSVETGKIREEITDLLSKIIAAIDFPEDVQEVEYQYLEEKIENIISKINYILSFSNSSNIFRQGIKIVLAGRPNVGKSSLFNALLNLDRAIVTDIAGTTRDVIQETIDIDGISATIIDTAGIREGENLNKVEAIGIDYSKKYVQEADVVLFLYDLNDGFTKEDEMIFETVKEKNHIKVATKSDLLSRRKTDVKQPPTQPLPLEALVSKKKINIENVMLNSFQHLTSCTYQAEQKAKKIPKQVRDDEVVCISLKTGENLEILKAKIKNKLEIQNLTEIEFITNQRQQKALEETKNALINALAAVQNQELQDLISIDIKSALMFISEVSGEVITDDILNNIFDNFCIGK